MDDYSQIIDFITESNAIPTEFRCIINAWVSEHAEDPEFEKSLKTAWERMLDQSRSKEDVAGLSRLLDEVNPDWDQSTLNEYVAGQCGKKHPFFVRFKKVLTYAAVALVLVMSLITTYLFTNSSGEDSMEIVTAQGSVYKITLPDGSKVLLNSGSKLCYSKSEFGGNKTRNVKLEGEAFFDVVHNEKSPFIVEMSGMDVEVLGTTFDVKDYGHSPYKEVVLLSGKVKVEETSGEKRSYTLNPDQRFVLDSSTGKSVVEDVNAINYCSWYYENIKVENEPLRNVLITLSRKYCLDLEIKSDVNVDKNIALTIGNEPIEDVMTTISCLMDFEYEITNNTLIIKKK